MALQGIFQIPIQTTKRKLVSCGKIFEEGVSNPPPRPKPISHPLDGPCGHGQKRVFKILLPSYPQTSWGHIQKLGKNGAFDFGQRPPFD